MSHASPEPPAASRRPRSAMPVARVLEHIERNVCEPLRLEDLAAIACLSVFRFATVFREQLGVPPYRYICRLRVERAQTLLRAGLPAARVAGETGFYDQSHLSRHFKSVCGMTPGQYRARCRREGSPRLECAVA